MINESFDGSDTPSKKRKREAINRFVSSTPIKFANKENFLFSDSLCMMEQKSIADLVAERNASKASCQSKINEFEVIRKPPKKKKKNSEDGGFVNPGLDLKADENPINPFEVVRSDNTEAIMLAKGFSNSAVEEVLPEEAIRPAVSTNPFEVVRETTEPPPAVKGIDNSALELVPPPHNPLMLSLPFTPTINHRIDFSNMPENLTPSSLLSTKLVLESNDVGTPRKEATVKARKSLSAISEEIEIDIGEELDNYQLQLENSINEAKLQNRKYVFDAQQTIVEEPEEEEVALETDKVVNDATYTKDVSKTIEVSIKEIHITTTETHSGLKESSVDEEVDNEDVQFEEVDSFEENFGNLGRFQRAYRTNAPPTFKQPVAPASAEPKKTNLGGSIRRSIRKLISHKKENSTESSEHEKHDGLFQSIRHSLRRKPKPKAAPVSLETTIAGRTVFRETSVNEDEARKTLERATLKRQVVKTVRSFMENVEEFNHF